MQKTIKLDMSLEVTDDGRILGNNDPYYGGIMYRVAQVQRPVSPIADSDNSISSYDLSESQIQDSIENWF